MIFEQLLACLINIRLTPCFVEERHRPIMAIVGTKPTSSSGLYYGDTDSSRG